MSSCVYGLNIHETVESECSVNRPFWSSILDVRIHFTYFINSLVNMIKYSTKLEIPFWKKSDIEKLFLSDFTIR